MTTAQRRARVATLKRKRRYRRERLLAAKRTSDKVRQAHWKHLLDDIDHRIAHHEAVLHNARPLRLRAYDEAIKLVGVREQGGNNTGPMVTAIIRANGGTGPEPWCGDAMAWCYRRAGSKAVTRSWASVVLLGSVVGVHRVSKGEVKRGDLVRFNFPGGSSIADHVGMFDHWINEAAGVFATLEGNTGVANVSDAGGGEGFGPKTRNMAQVRDFLRVTN